MELLQELCDVAGVSGFEEAAQDIVFNHLTQCTDKTWRDRLGNVIGVRYAERTGTEQTRIPKLVYAAHIDEIGFMVSHIDENGFIRFKPIGGFDLRTLPSQKVTVHGTKNGRAMLNGVIAPQPGWLGTDEDRSRVFTFKELYIDVALTSEMVRDQVNIGDVISLATPFSNLNDFVVTGRNFDDRVGVYCMLEAMKQIDTPSVDVYAVSTVQEEVGVRGMSTAAYAIGADIALAIDGSLASDVPFADPYEQQGHLGAGTGIYLMDNRTIADPKLIEFLTELCEKKGIAYQRNIGGGTDASVLQRSGLGALATTIGAPTRYMHSTVQLCHTQDLEATIALLTAFAGCADKLLPPDWTTEPVST